MKSLLQGNKKECYLTGRRDFLERHHIFFGSANRKKSEQWGCWVWLVPELHNASSEAVHFNRELDLRLKRECQEAFEKKYGHKLFMREFGKNYLDPAEPSIGRRNIGEF